MFQVPTVPVNISKDSRVFCRPSGRSIGRRSFGKLPTSFRSRKLWLTSAGPFYRDGFFSLRTFVSREVTSRLYPCALLADVTDARMCAHTHGPARAHIGACILRASIPLGACGGIVSVSTLTDEIATKTNAYLQRFSVYRVHSCPSYNSSINTWATKGVNSSLTFYVTIYISLTFASYIR